MAYPEIMNPRLSSIPAHPQRIRIPRDPIHDGKTNRTGLGKLQAEIIVDARHRMVMLVDHEMVTLSVAVAFVQLDEV